MCSWDRTVMVTTEKNETDSNTRLTKVWHQSFTDYFCRFFYFVFFFSSSFFLSFKFRLVWFPIAMYVKSITLCYVEREQDYVFAVSLCVYSVSAVHLGAMWKLITGSVFVSNSAHVNWCARAGSFRNLFFFFFFFFKKYLVWAIACPLCEIPYLFPAVEFEKVLILKINLAALYDGIEHCGRSRQNYEMLACILQPRNFSWKLIAKRPIHLLQRTSLSFELSVCCFGQEIRANVLQNTTMAVYISDMLNKRTCFGQKLSIQSLRWRL